MSYMLNAFTKIIDGFNGAVILKTDTEEFYDLNMEEYNELIQILEGKEDIAENEQGLLSILIEQEFLVRTEKRMNTDYFKYFDFSLEKGGMVSFKLSKLILEFDGRCSLNCKFCGKGVFASCFCKKNNTEIFRYNLKELVEIIINYSVQKIMVIGGDPFFYSFKYMTKFLDILTQKGYLGEVVICSNLAEWKEEHFLILRNYKNVRVNILMLGFNKYDYEKITGNENVFDKVIKNIERIKQYNIFCNITFLLSRLNIKSVTDVKNFTRYEIPVGYKTLFREEYTDLAMLMDYRKRIMSIDYYQLQLLENTNCCLYSQLFISSDFKVYPCPSLKDFCLGDLKKEKIENIIRKQEYKRFWFLNRGEIDKCNMCKYRVQCYDCRAVEYAVTKDLYKEYYCDIDIMQSEEKY